MTKNDAKLAKRQESSDVEILNGNRFLDRGFNRPKVVLIASLMGCMQSGLGMIRHLLMLVLTTNTCMRFFVGRD